jgi:diguanylate cyclase (GGDEF)-like protein
MDDINISPYIDSITELPNNYALNSVINEVIDSIVLGITGKKKTIYSIMMCDVNNLKFLNDEFGHNAGDKGLRKIGKIINQCIRNNDEKRKDGIFLLEKKEVFRIGGDEFLIILKDCDRKNAEIVKKRIINKIELEKDSNGFVLSLAIGIVDTSEINVDKNNVDKRKIYLELREKADARMYKDKKKMKKAMNETEKDLFLLATIHRLSDAMGIDIKEDPNAIDKIINDLKRVLDK